MILKAAAYRKSMLPKGKGKISALVILDESFRQGAAEPSQSKVWDYSLRFYSLLIPSPKGNPTFPSCVVNWGPASFMNAFRLFAAHNRPRRCFFSVNGCIDANSNDKIRWTAKIPAIVKTRQPVPLPQDGVDAEKRACEGFGDHWTGTF